MQDGDDCITEVFWTGDFREASNLQVFLAAPIFQVIHLQLHSCQAGLLEKPAPVPKGRVSVHSHDQGLSHGEVVDKLLYLGLDLLDILPVLFQPVENQELRGSRE